MNSASVGFHCPECLSVGQRNRRQVTTALGGRVPDKPLVTYTLIGINAALFILGSLLQVAGDYSLNSEFGMWPLGIAVNGEWWRLLTSAFLHGGLWHIGFNMLLLYLLGNPLETVMGHGRFLTLYVLSALGGSIASYAFSPVNTLSVGASGAVFGLMAAYLVIGRRFDRDTSSILFIFGLNIVIGFLVPGIDWRAHLGGAAAGAVIGAVLAYTPRENRNLWQSLGVLAVLAVLVAVTMVRTADLTDAIALFGSPEQPGAVAAPADLERNDPGPTLR